MSIRSVPQGLVVGGDQRFRDVPPSSHSLRSFASPLEGGEQEAVNTRRVMHRHAG